VVDLGEGWVATGRCRGEAPDYLLVLAVDARWALDEEPFEALEEDDEPESPEDVEPFDAPPPVPVEPFSEEGFSPPEVPAGEPFSDDPPSDEPPSDEEPEESDEPFARDEAPDDARESLR